MVDTKLQECCGSLNNFRYPRGAESVVFLLATFSFILQRETIRADLINYHVRKNVEFVS